MFLIGLSIVFLILAGLSLKNPMQMPSVLSYVLSGLFVIASIASFLALSYVYVDANQIATKNRIYFGEVLPEGRIIAMEGQKGPQAEILGPGFHLSPFIRFIYDIEYHDVPFIPEGKYGILVAKDGASLRDNQFIADKWADGEFDNMLDAKYFLTHGGQKGPQLDVLKPGKYRINPLLWKIQVSDSLDVPTGTVAVIRSNVQTAKNCDPIAIEGVTGGAVSTPIVPNNCIGVWANPLMPGRYYLNEMAYVPTIIPTRLITWTYKGGYVKRKIDLKVEDDGSITQEETRDTIKTPSTAADQAITIRAEGWEFPVEVRAVVQVHPENAPMVVASVGTLDRVEDNIVTPTIRDVMRTIGGAEGRRVMDFVEKRDTIVTEAEAVVASEAAKAGVSLQELRLGEAAIPPELMVATLREQLATQLQSTYQQEKKAQTERIQTEKERATADQQQTLVIADIDRQAAIHRKATAKLDGEGERDRLIEIAKGQAAQRDVLGAETVAHLKMVEMYLKAATENPNIVKVPVVNVAGGSNGSSLEGAAAILGASNLANAIGQSQVSNLTSSSTSTK